MTYNPALNYCTFSPEELFGVRFNHSCYLHDRQYRNEVKLRKNRLQADQDLRDWIYKLIKESNKPFVQSIWIPVGVKKFWLPKLKYKKILSFQSESKFLIFIRSFFLSFIVSRTYYYAVRLFAKRGWKE